MAEDEADDTATTPPAETRRKGHATLVMETQAATEERERKRREEEAVKDEKQEARLDAANDKALAAESKRADAAEKVLVTKDKNWTIAMEGKDTTIKRLWLANIVQILIIAALAGHEVGLDIPGFGKMDIGGDSQTESTVGAPAPAGKEE